MLGLNTSDLVYLEVTYALLAASAVTWVYLLEATVARDRVTL